MASKLKITMRSVSGWCCIRSNGAYRSKRSKGNSHRACKHSQSISTCESVLCRWVFVKCRHPRSAALPSAVVALFLLIFAAAAVTHVDAADADLQDEEETPRVVRQGADDREGNDGNEDTNKETGQHEAEIPAPRTVRVAIVGGGISAAATATFLSILEKQIYHERLAKLQMDEKEQQNKDGAPSNKKWKSGRRTAGLQRKQQRRWWMYRPIKFQTDLYEGAEHFGGRVDYGEVAGRHVEMGIVDVNGSNFWMTVFHDLLNEFADNLGGTGWSTLGDQFSKTTEKAKVAPAMQRAAPPQAHPGADGVAVRGNTLTGAYEGEEEHWIAQEGQQPLETLSGSHRSGYGESVAEVESSIDNYAEGQPTVSRTAAQHWSQKRGEDVFYNDKEYVVQMENLSQEDEGRTMTEGPYHGSEISATEATTPGEELIATTQINPYTRGWKSPFTFPPPLTEFQSLLSPGPIVLLHDESRATLIPSLTMAIINSGATTLSGYIRHIVRRWKSIYDFTFGGKMCAKRAAMSLFPGREHYIAPHPSRQHPDGRPYCSTVEQAKAAAVSAFKMVEILGLESEVKRPFAALLHHSALDPDGQHLLDSLVRAVYGQRAENVHALAGLLALAGTYETPFDRKRYSNRVLVEFLIARTVDASFLSCPISSIIELEDDIISAAQKDDGGIHAQDHMMDANAKKETFRARVSGGRVPRRRKRFKLEATEEDGCLNAAAREHLNNTTYDFVVVALPLEDSAITLYRRKSVRQTTGKASAAAVREQQEEAQATMAAEEKTIDNENDDRRPSSDNTDIFFEKSAALHLDEHDETETERKGWTEVTSEAMHFNEEQKEEKTKAHTLTAQAPQENTDASGIVFREEKEGAQGVEEKHCDWSGETSHWRELKKSKETLVKVTVPQRPFAAMQITCVGADGLVNITTEEDRMYRSRSRRKKNRYMRPPATTLLTSDSLSSKYFSFGELFTASCQDVAESELDELAASTPVDDESGSGLFLFFNEKEEGPPSLESNHEADEKEKGDHREIEGPMERTSSTATLDDLLTEESHVKIFAPDDLNAGQPRVVTVGADGFTAQENAGLPPEKTFYYPVKSLSVVGEGSFFSRIKNTASLNRQLGKTICCAVTSEGPDDGDLADIFKHVRHTGQRSYFFARPKVYPLLQPRKQTTSTGGRRRKQVYIWKGKRKRYTSTLFPEVTSTVLMENVFYTSGFENILPCTEGVVIAGKNVANLVLKAVLENYDD